VADFARITGCLRLLRKIEAGGEQLTNGRTADEPLLSERKRKRFRQQAHRDERHVAENGRLRLVPFSQGKRVETLGKNTSR
jgi:CelD/BcsL family acetyltransferase involved in cellulose biosynthesis